MFGLILFTHKGFNKWFVLFTLVAIVGGIGLEMIGTSTGWLFGKYRYGTALGFAVKNVPLIIGVNWFIVIYCVGMTINTLLNKILERITPKSEAKPTLKTLSIIVDGATLALLFDYLMEPIAVKLGYWQWLGDGHIPFYNYLCWFVISGLLLTVFQFSPFKKRNKFAVNLLLIQSLFFLLLRTFL